ncbi:hypothetical protein GQR58_013504 [Nymphon striatum]|nr:hypothetical protein GQR58_013504 [Nymphon striatum]
MKVEEEAKLKSKKLNSTRKINYTYKKKLKRRFEIIQKLKKQVKFFRKKFESSSTTIKFMNTITKLKTKIKTLQNQKMYRIKKERLLQQKNLAPSPSPIVVTSQLSSIPNNIQHLENENERLKAKLQKLQLELQADLINTLKDDPPNRFDFSKATENGQCRYKGSQGIDQLADLHIKMRQFRIMRKRKCPRNLAGEESADLGLPKIKKISSIKNSKPRKQKNSQPSCELETNKVNGQNNNSVDHNHNSIEPKNSSGMFNLDLIIFK